MNGASLVAQNGVKNLPAVQETAGLIPGESKDREDPLAKENGNPFQYSCLGNARERGTRWATVPGVTKSWTRLSD